MQRDYTPEEITAMHEYNESFVGKQADFAKVRLYRRIKAEQAAMSLTRTNRTLCYGWICLS